ncbi:MAG: methyltransferase domain-containing protein [Anaerolineales bacterium]
MATVLMKWLETSPEQYDRGIQMLTLGRLKRVHRELVEEFVQPGMRVLEIGCGTGTLTLAMARRGAQVTGIDVSPEMLGAAGQRVVEAKLQEFVSLKLMDAAFVEDTFPPHSFDLIVASLSLSEMTLEQQPYLLAACRELLAEDGRLVVVDETSPRRRLLRGLVGLLRLPLALITWLLTRTGTRALAGFDTLLAQAGYTLTEQRSYLAGTLGLFTAVPDEQQPAPRATVVGRLRHKVTPWTILKDVYLLINRLIPPYPRVRPGLYAVGEPDEKSPVLVTGNFDLTVRRLVREIDRQVDAWVLVVDTAGVNVWCAAGGGFLTAEKVAAEVIRHHALVLPQLAACGVDGWKLRKLTGFGVHWGPVRAADIPAYLSAHRKKDAAMRTVRFPLAERLEMVTVTLAFYALMILLPVGIFWPGIFWPVTVALLGLAYFYAIVHPWLPGRDGLEKAIPLTVIALLGGFAYWQLFPAASGVAMFHWAVGLVGLSVFTAAELQGMSPWMRGEQANWTIESVVYAALGLVYFGLPWLAGW